MNNELTLRISVSFDEFKNILINKKFKLIKVFTLDDLYLIPNNIKSNYESILNNNILIRKIITDKEKCELVFKEKVFDGNTIIKNDSYKCTIDNIQNAIIIFHKLNYRDLINIKEYDEVYSNGDIEICLKNVENFDNLIEIETNDKYNIYDIKNKLDELNLPIDKSNYYVTKLKEMLK